MIYILTHDQHQEMIMQDTKFNGEDGAQYNPANVLLIFGLVIMFLFALLLVGIVGVI
jgi:tetrahydromethanopterin S-methyltransferase subunit F